MPPAPGLRSSTKQYTSSSSSAVNKYGPRGAGTIAPSADLLNSGLVGASLETGSKVWDPWGLSNWVPAEYARAAELANGRSAMLATVGWVFPKYIGHFAGDVSTDPVEAIFQADPQWWAQFVLLCGVCEANKYASSLRDDGVSSQGEADKKAFYDPFRIQPKSEEGRKLMQERELRNGRLAMIGIAGFVANRLVEGSVPFLPSGF